VKKKAVKTFRKKQDYGKGLKIFLVLAVASLLFVGYVKIFRGGSLRDYEGAGEKRITETKERIAEIQESRLDDAKKSERLAAQYAVLGSVYLEKRRWGEAIDSYYKSIQYGNISAVAHYSLGVAYGNRGAEKADAADFEKAESSYRKALDMDGNLVDARYGLALVLFYHREGGRDEGVSQMEQAVALKPTHYMARFALARFYYEMGRPEQSLKAYEDLSADLAKLPSSQLKDEYVKNCDANIKRLMEELADKTGG